MHRSGIARAPGVRYEAIWLNRAGIARAVRYSAVGGMGGCPFAAYKGAAGNVCTEDVVFLCQELGIETGIDLDRLIEASKLAERVVGHELAGKLKQGGNLATYRARARAAAPAAS